MASNSSMSSTGDKSGSIYIGQERAEAATALQKELLEAYEQAGRAWLACSQKLPCGQSWPRS